ncbi:unnamed protein product [Paramecium primaurelia]|uniref:Uncharacterized protein n=1 Tax=Paramecium primaurelia TaxID=5886 RepID=A0A8S1QGP7_PARPR|nr:unnamed protein product [Paramecium primaurelia]
MGCSMVFIQKASFDSNSSFSYDDIQESEVSLDQIHDGIAFLKINVKKQKEIFPEDNNTEVKHLVNCNHHAVIQINKSDIKSKKSCLKQKLITSQLSQNVSPKIVHFVQIQQQNTNQYKRRQKKSKQKHSRKSKERQEHINLDDIF